MLLLLLLSHDILEPEEAFETATVPSFKVEEPEPGLLIPALSTLLLSLLYMGLTLTVTSRQ